MKAKFVYEYLGDIFKPKSEEDIWSSMGDLSPDTLFYKSAENGFLPGIKKALKDGANVHIQNDYALLLASQNDYYDIVKFLLERGANVHANDDLALRIALRFGYHDIVELLKKWMNKPIKESIGDVLKPKSEEEIWSSMRDLDPNYLLINSAESGFLPGVNKALEDGANVHAENDYALRYASEYGHYDIVALLLDNGADVHAFDDDALRYASEYGYQDIVELLKKYM